MSSRSAHPPVTPKQPPRPVARLFDERHDAKHDSPFYELAGPLRRSLRQELQADRKR